MKIISLSDLPEEGVSHNPEIKKKVMLRNGEIPNLTSFSQARLISGQVVGAHAHEDVYEIFLIEAGMGIVRVGDKEYRVEKGVCIVVEPGEVHDISNTGTTEFVLTYFGLKDRKEVSLKTQPDIRRFTMIRKTEDAPASNEFKEAKSMAEEYAYDPDKTKELLDKATKKAKRKKNGPLGQVWEYFSALIRMVRAYIRGEHRDIPWESIVLSIAAIIYFISPVDFIPEFIPVVGYLDDLAVIAFVVRAIKTDLDNFLEWESEQEKAL